jgi:hypothetical protein
MVMEAGGRGRSEACDEARLPRAARHMTRAINNVDAARIWKRLIKPLSYSKVFLSLIVTAHQQANMEQAQQPFCLKLVFYLCNPFP